MARRSNLSIAIIAYTRQMPLLNVPLTEIKAASGVGQRLVAVASLMYRRSMCMGLEAQRPVRIPSFCAAARVLTFYNRQEALCIHLREPQGTVRRTEPSDHIGVGGVLLYPG